MNRMENSQEQNINEADLYEKIKDKGENFTELFNALQDFLAVVGGVDGVAPDKLIFLIKGIIYHDENMGNIPEKYNMRSAVQKLKNIYSAEQTFLNLNK